MIWIQPPGKEPEPPWNLEAWGEHLDAWIDRDHPDPDLSYVVTEWVLTRDATPYNAHRVSGFANLWETVVPGSSRGAAAPDRTVVHCSYWIEEARHTVRCNSITTLGWPVILGGSWTTEDDG